MNCEVLRPKISEAHRILSKELSKYAHYKCKGKTAIKIGYIAVKNESKQAKIKEIGSF